MRGTSLTALSVAATLAAPGISAAGAAPGNATVPAATSHISRHSHPRHPRRAPRVRVEVFGSAPAYKRLLDRTVTLTGRPVSRDGGSCSGNTAAGALQLATKGDWSGTWNTEYADYEVTTIDGLKLAFNSKSSANWYWSFDIGGKEASAGVCDVKPKNGQRIVFKPACYGKSCPKAKAARITDPADRR